MRRPKKPGELLTVADMAMRIFRTRRPARLEEVRQAAEELLEQYTIRLPADGPLFREYLVDRCMTSGSSEPVLLMDERLEAVLREKLKVPEFLPIDKEHFLNPSQLHKTYRCFGNNAMRPYQRQAINEVLDDFYQRVFLDVRDADGTTERMMTPDVLVHCKKAAVLDYFFDPRLRNAPELAEEKIVARSQQLRAQSEKPEKGKAEYPAPEKRHWKSASEVAKRFGMAFRTAAARIAVETQLKELYEKNVPGVGLFAVPPKTGGVYRIDPVHIGLIDKERVEREMKALPRQGEMER